MKPGNQKQNRLFILVILCAIFVLQAAALPTEVYVGGMPFGVRMDAGEVSIVRLQPFLSAGKMVSPAEEAGLQPEDILITINRVKVSTSQEVTDQMRTFTGEDLPVRVLRGGREMEFILHPRCGDETGQMQMGLLLKDSSAGIGTVTYICPDGCSFAGLGHGICQSSGELIRLSDGYISSVRLHSVNKGKAGAPGELRGALVGDPTGKLLANTNVGVFGKYGGSVLPGGSLVPIAAAEDVTLGKATILCTLPGLPCTEYTIEITDINRECASQTKNFIVKVSDKRLLNQTGGIVQGMSGSPILQNGKLIGAVTHVMVNDPTTGYGIYIGNMLQEMERWI